MTAERSEPSRAARTVVLGAGALLLAYFLARPLAPHVSVLASGMLLSVAIWALAHGLSRRTQIPYRAAVAVVILIALGLLTALVAWTGPLLAEQLAELEDAVRRGVANAREWLERTDVGREALVRGRQLVSSLGGGVVGGVATGVRTGFEVITGALIAVLLGVFIAVSPRRYVDGALRLLPPARRPRVREVIEVSIATLRSWLAARLLLMGVIGAAFGVALAILGIPLAFPLGVLTGVLAFIPYVGAALSVLPAIAVAFAEGPDKALQVLLVYVVIQLAETYLLDPIVEARAVRLAPAMVLLAQVIAVVWFGPVAVLYATPLLVVVVVAVRMLYLEDRLDDHAPEGPPRKEHRLRWPAFLRLRPAR